MQNLLDNARKYNRRNGTIRILAHRAGREVELRVANTGRGIPAEAQPFIFERFHRAGASQDVPGHGLGLNLARELVRLHGGELILVRSDAEWTEFSARFRSAGSQQHNLPTSPDEDALSSAPVSSPPSCAAFAAEDFLDEVDEALTISVFHDQVRARVSGLLDLEYYHYPQPPPGLIRAEGHDLFAPRLSVFLDAKIGPNVYFFAQTRVDTGFDPSDLGVQWRLDEYALRITPWTDGRFNLQLGKFSTVIGSWVPRHLSWDNPLINAPLPYETATLVSDRELPLTGQSFRRVPGFDKYEFLPIVWGPAYTIGASVAGSIGIFEYAAAIKNAPVSSRPESWDTFDFGHPSYELRLGMKPNQAWNFGFSAAAGPYLAFDARPLPAGADRSGLLPVSPRPGCELRARPSPDLGGSFRGALRSAAARKRRRVCLLHRSEISDHAATLRRPALEPGIFCDRERS